MDLLTTDQQDRYTRVNRAPRENEHFATNFELVSIDDFPGDPQVPFSVIFVQRSTQMYVVQPPEMILSAAKYLNEQEDWNGKIEEVRAIYKLEGEISDGWMVTVE